MTPAVREAVCARAADKCEYCLVHQAAIPAFKFHVEHIIPRQHQGANDLENLALACIRCNLLKGPNLTALDPESGRISTLFHPRHQDWKEHFSCLVGFVVGITPTGRATVRLLRMNDTDRCKLRMRFPPEA